MPCKFKKPLVNFQRSCFHLVIGLLLLVSLVNITPPASHAQESISTSISPLTFELTANPGETKTNTVRVTNLADQPVPYSMLVQSFVGNEFGQATVIPDSQDPTYALSQWVTVSPQTFTLAPKSSQNVTFTINIPANAEPGGRYGTILASANSSVKTLNGSGEAVSPRVGALVLLTVQGPINYTARVATFQPTQKLYQHAPATLTLRIYNGSTVHITPVGFITLTNIFGQKVATIPVDPKIILPQNYRLIETNTSANLAIGYYTTNLALVYGDKNAQLLSTSSFIIFPWKIGIPVIVVVLLLLWFIVAYRRRFAEALRIIFGRK
jgi:hypothetical protein